MSKKEEYLFVGTILLPYSANKFITPIYEKNNCFYIHTLKNEKVVRFKKIRLKNEIMIFKNSRKLYEGDFGMYCYTYTKNGEEKFVKGSRTEIEPELLALLAGNFLNVHAKLILSSFLKLHGKTYELIKESQKEITAKKININLRKSDFISTRERKTIDNTLYQTILDRYTTIKKECPELFIEDLTLIENTTVYFDKSKLDLDTFLSGNLDSFEGLLNDLIKYSIYKERIKLGDSLKKCNKLYWQTLVTDVKIDTYKTNELLSSIIIQTEEYHEKSVLDIGLEVEKQLSILKRENLKENQLVFEKILKDAKNIKKEMTKTNK